MKLEGLPPVADAAGEIAALTATLHEAGQRLEELTSGEVDTVAGEDGRVFLLQRAQEQLRRSTAERHTAILNALPANIALLDANGVITSVNEAWRRFAGANGAHLPGHGIGVNYLATCDSAKGDDALQAREAAAGIRSILGGAAQNFSMEYPCDSPSQKRWFLMTVTPAAEKSPRGTVVMHQDITERRHADEESRRFASAMDAASDAIYLVDRASMSFVHVNDAACRMREQTREELLALGPAEVLSVSRAKLEQTYDALIASGVDAKPIEMQRRRKDGSQLWLDLRRHALRTGDSWTLVTLVRDITERKEAELRIKRLNRVHAVLSGINTAIVRHQSREELFREVCRIAVSEGQFTVARIIELDADGKARIAATTVFDSSVFQKIVDEYNANPEVSQTFLGLGLREGKPLVSNDVATDLRMPNRVALTKDGTFAFALLPIIVDGRIAGALTLRSRDAGMFDEAELKLLVEVVANLSFALEHIEKEAKIGRLTRVHAMLSGINTLIVRAANRDEMFADACRIAVNAGGFRLAWIATADLTSMKLKLIASEGDGRDYLERMPLSLKESDGRNFGMAGRVVIKGEAVVVDDMAQDPRIFLRDQARERGFHSLAMLPLVESNVVVGVLALYANEIGFFDAGEMKLLRELAGDIAFAVNHIGKNDRLKYLAFYDELTGLANRSLLLERVAQYMRSAATSGHKLALFFLDLERFRNINDSLGRPAGDTLLKQVADLLSRGAGDSNLLARVGADQFAIVLPALTLKGDIAHLLDSRIRQFVDHAFHLGDREIRIGVKVGVALFPGDGTDAATLLRNAETALKKAKRRGEPYLFYKPKMTAAVAGNLSLENQLREAVEKEEFVLYYQPKVNLESGKLTSAEALLRWNDPRTGLVPPGQFIPVLEETGLIQDVGRWALRQAIQVFLRWRAAGLPALRIAVNVSPLQLRNQGFVDEIRRIVSVDPHAAEGLELEITESLIMDDVEHNIAVLQAIRALGITIAIDDFGTGFSSLSYLAKLPVDTLKIDRSFVNDMALSPQGLSLVSTVITLAHSLNLKVVAEGVETEEQSRLLRLLRCDEMQGFLFSKPVPVEDFERKFLAPAAG